MKKVLAKFSAITLAALMCAGTTFSPVKPFSPSVTTVSAASTSFASQSRCTITDVRSYTTGYLNFTISRNYGLKLKTLNVLGVQDVGGGWFFPTGVQIMVYKNGYWTSLYNSHNNRAGYLDTANRDYSTINFGNLDFTEMKSALIKGRYLKLSLVPVRVEGNRMHFGKLDYYAPAVYFDYYNKRMVSEATVNRS